MSDTECGNGDGQTISELICPYKRWILAMLLAFGYLGVLFFVAQKDSNTALTSISGIFSSIIAWYFYKDATTSANENAIRTVQAQMLGKGPQGGT